MQVSGIPLKPFSFAVLIHIAAFSLLIVSFDMDVTTINKPAANTNIVNAVAINNKAVDKELQKLKDIDAQKRKKQQQAQEKLKRTQKELAAAEEKRRNEEKRLADTRKKQQEEQKKRQAEQEKVAQLQKDQAELVKQQKLAEEKKRKAEADRARILAEEKQRQEAERKLQQQEAALKKKQAEEKRAQAAAQAKKDQQLLRNIYAELKQKVTGNFNISGLPSGLKCEIEVRVLPGGEIINARISKSSGNDIFDSRALTALQKASPLPVPEDAATLDRLNLRHFIFQFSPGE